MNQLTTCPTCGASLSNWEQKEQECFTCGWSKYDGLNDTIPAVPPNFELTHENHENTEE